MHEHRTTVNHGAQKARLSPAGSARMRPVLMMPVGHTPDWSAAARYVGSLAHETVSALTEDATVILGQRSRLDEAIVHQRLRDGLCELRAAMRGATSPTSALNCSWHPIRGTAVLFEPHPIGRPTYLFGFIRLLDRARVLAVLGCRSLCEVDQDAADWRTS